MDVVVTGSSGLIGSALIDALTDAGHHPIRLVRDTGPTTQGGDTLRWDPAAGTIDAEGFEGVDAVVHLAGESIASHRWTAEQKRRILASRVDGTTLIAETIASRRNPPRALVSASASRSPAASSKREPSPSCRRSISSSRERSRSPRSKC